MLPHYLSTISSYISKCVISIETSVDKIRLNRSTMEDTYLKTMSSLGCA
jgi:hypothetical protein